MIFFTSERNLITIHISYDSFTNLLQYGLTESVKADFIQICTSDSELRPGRVARVDGISTYVHADTGDFRAGSNFAQITSDDESEIEPIEPTVGDWVLVRPGDNQDSDEIEFVLPRTSLLIRNRSVRGRSKGKSDEQILAANVNTVFIVQAANNFNVSRLEREVALVWSSGAVPVIVVSKIDLIQDVDSLRFVRRLELAAPGVEVFAVSGLTGIGIAPLHRFITTGETVALVGASGVGKSTLANQLIGEKVMDTDGIRKSDTRGRHTTVTRQLLPLSGGGVLIDTPGIRTIGLVEGREDALAKTFSEIEEYKGRCKFRDCAHEDEPGCAITEAIASGRLLGSRFESYNRLLQELEDQQANNDRDTKTDKSMQNRIKAIMMRQQFRNDK